MSMKKMRSLFPFVIQGDFSVAEGEGGRRTVHLIYSYEDFNFILKVRA
jgi:hypothetical protein